jgi:RNA polymerase sigma-70 factor (ECF subfamily)
MGATKRLLNHFARPRVLLCREEQRVDETIPILLAQAQAGDHAAFEALHGAFLLPLLRFTRRLVPSDEEAEDIVQETFMTLYLHLGKINPPEKLRPFLYRVARNRCYDRLRRSGRYEQVEWEDDDAAPRVRVSFAGQMAQAGDDDAAHWLMLHLEVRAAMESLPELQRQTLLLYAEEELSYQEIADIMEVSIGTVKSRIFHAKRGLRRLLPRETLAAIEDGAIAKAQVSDIENADEARLAPTSDPVS